MSVLNGRKIVLGVCGSIAAYKAAVLTRLLVKAGCSVRVVMTRSAIDFVGPLTFSTLSKHPILHEFIKSEDGGWNNHVELGLWADALVVAPCSANTLAKFAHGICDNLLTAVYLSARCPVFLAPAMDLDMLAHPSTRSNLDRLRSFGNHLIDTGYGELASGLTGDGRMAEPEEIVRYLEDALSSAEKLRGKRALVTAGPTQEAIDPVRYIGNRSSGKMGFAIAERLAQLGATVNLVTGPTSLHTSHPHINVTQVVSAQEMYDACVSAFPETDIAVLAAAVADYRPAVQHEQKIKKSGDETSLALVPTKDIAAALGGMKKNGQFVVGFALETENEKDNAISKLASKNLDMIVLNSLRDEGAAFGHDTNKVTIIDREQNATSFGLKSKKEVAEDIVNAIVEKIID
ncbi:MAG: bifunctional phosphopantothenoylcysteine decarboxylase/phosphopantothenate--cysteine ligase CoaBC [Bacteroidota bacterium]|jgi:phosphopantothenoylcysteine decarboxylase/phosphopantothenate--cysteine ligase|nr:MAG: bifunctional phosphopantothenoylcysteine decarboxylase/phosphopantothenate--cysteine ligase CoaBC [Bacteroidota bacterium]